jgi:hypothetical protein
LQASGSASECQLVFDSLDSGNRSRNLFGVRSFLQRIDGAGQLSGSPSEADFDVITAQSGCSQCSSNLLGHLLVGHLAGRSVDRGRSDQAGRL